MRGLSSDFGFHVPYAEVERFVQNGRPVIFIYQVTDVRLFGFSTSSGSSVVEGHFTHVGQVSVSAKNRAKIDR